MTLQEIRQAVEAWRDTHGPKIVRRQARYLARHGRYWQGVAALASPPDDGARVAADWTRKPTDQQESWADVFVSDADGDDRLPATVPARVRVDVYDGPRGKGWSLTVEIQKGGRTFARTWHVGPEDGREAPWQEETR